ncbi:hypothetical protein BOX15_Mlig022710g1 [Macrostomum lignano]|uniref:Uncharacterized protein n=1 Tax=Macrostomum lignano TaxID=282301 RepID=A0A267H7L8_9PLAT|nr:hypothetical protein BOX15_Mlig022710g1 [Macrostomum lignano]
MLALLLQLLQLSLLTLPTWSVQLSSDAYPPRTFQHSQNKVPIIRKEGDRHGFVCEANGRPDPTYAWQKVDPDTQTTAWVRGNHTSTYRIDRVTRSDAGRYRCYAFNSQGGLRDSSVTLLIGYLNASRLSNGRTNRNIKLVSGETLRLPVPPEIDAYPAPSARWRRNGFTLSTSDRVYVTTKHELIILDVGKSDHGRVFDATISSNYLDAATKVTTPLYTLKVSSPPQPAPAQRRPTPVLYSGNVTHVTGGFSNAVFECVFAAKPLDRLKLRWYRKELNSTAQTELASDGVKYLIEPRYSRRLTVYKVQPSDAAKYACEAQLVGNDIVNSPVVRLEAWLTVLTPPKLTRTEPDDLWLDHGSDRLLGCRAEGNPTPRIEWYRNAELVSNSTRYQVRRDDYLQLLRVQPEDSGIFQCFAVNSAGEDYHTSWLRISSSSPKFTKRPSDGTGVIANSISFDCAATGAPAPKILWHKDKIPIVHTERVQQRPDGSLSITRLVANDAGEYECIATSETGTIRASSVLAVYNRTRVSPRPAARVEAAKGSNAQLNCSAVADSRLANRLTVSWTYRPTFGGESYRPVVTGVTGRSVSTGTSLALGNLRSSDAGLYRCQADAGPAGGGPDEAEIQLTVIELPTSPGPPITGLLTADHGSSDGINSDCQLLGGIRVTWPEAEFDGNSPLTGYAVQYQINGDSPDIWRAAKKVNRDSADGLFQKRSMCLSASVLQTSGVAYRFRVLAVNKLGFSTGSRPSDWVFLPSRPPSGPPQSFFLFGGESNSSLRASWEPPKPRHRQGRLLGYQIRHSIVGYPAGVSERLLNVTEPDVTSALLTDLQPNTEYNAWIAAVNEQGRGPWTSPAKTARTAEGRPLSAPAGVTVAPVTPRSARIEFDALLRAQLPGRLVSYSIVAECQAEAVAADLAPEEAPEPCERVEKLVSHVDTASRVSVVLDGLRPHTSYQVSVRAKTGAGFGPASAPPVAMETVPDAPGPPRGQLTVTRVRDTAARIGWKPPLRPNGIVTGYRVSWKPTVATDAASTLLHSNDAGSVDVKDVRRYDLTGLRPSTRYQVGVSAVNSAGVGASAIVEFVTRSRATAPDAPRQLRQVGVLARSARLQFLPPLSDGGAPVTAWLPEVQRAVAPVSTGSSLMTEDGHRSVGEAPVGGDWVAMKELPVPDGDSDRWRPEESQQLLLQGLRPFTRYRVRLSAKNSRGVSSPSAPPSDWFITMATLPEKPPARFN